MDRVEFFKMDVARCIPGLKGWDSLLMFAWERAELELGVFGHGFINEQLSVATITVLDHCHVNSSCRHVFVFLFQFQFRSSMFKFGGCMVTSLRTVISLFEHYNIVCCALLVN